MSKYGNKRTVIDGVVFDSQAEANYGQILELRRRAKDIKSWETQFEIEFPVPNGNIFMRHFIDFMIILPDGSRELHEVKSRPTEKDPVYRLKRNAMFEFYGIGGQSIRYKRRDYQYKVVMAGRDF